MLTCIGGNLRMKYQYKVDDLVCVISGNDKQKFGKVVARDTDRIIVQGVNVRKKHVKPQQGQQGQIAEIERPIHISNVTACDANGAPQKLKRKVSKDGEKSYVYMKDGKEVEYSTLKGRKA